MSYNRRRRRRGVAVILAAAAAMAFAAYAFTATNTVPGSSAGDGSGAISGYTISNIQYQLEAANPANIDSVSLTTSANAGTVRVKVVAASTTYTACTGGPTNWSCDFSTNPTVVSADQLRVIAVQ
jgi:hypothetical protein